RPSANTGRGKNPPARVRLRGARKSPPRNSNTAFTASMVTPSWNSCAPTGLSSKPPRKCCGSMRKEWKCTFKGAKGNGVRTGTGTGTGPRARNEEKGRRTSVFFAFFVFSVVKKLQQRSLRSDPDAQIHRLQLADFVAHPRRLLEFEVARRLD